MARGRGIRSHCRKFSSKYISARCSLPSFRRPITTREGKMKKTPFTSEKKDWKGVSCPVCMEYPHNAVLLLCSSYKKGCRPYMCATSYRYSNCFEQLKKAHTKTTLVVEDQIHDLLPTRRKSEVTELACPLCRGQVKGWTVVEPARKYLNKKSRSCTQDECSFSGNYKELRKHVHASHPHAKPRVVDPVTDSKWRNMEYQQERADLISTIRSSMPRSVILGDYVIEMGVDDSNSNLSDFHDHLFDVASRMRDHQSIFSTFLRHEARRRLREAYARNLSIINQTDDDDDDEGED
ncbi:uncharacterized protein LOC121970973 [Zingiber officinale]|uniref:uncharacterized protein LOC121970973 n=1 Tax=Zingiber officinale TaxID=94328 RepID=UPI001C4D368B|nr:uncharacterized protein LOC121970973 [Zingiber officinale]